jgi:hypothetical protein
MQTRLKRSTNLILQICGALIVLFFFMMLRLGIVVPVIVGAVAGALSGLMQREAIRAAAGLLVEAVTYAQVRAALNSTPEGRIAKGLIWIGAAAIAVITKLGGDQAFFYRFLAGFVASLIVREALSRKALVNLETTPTVIAPDSSEGS